MNEHARRAMARLTHATAHEAMTLRTLLARVEREGVSTVVQVRALIAEMLSERVRRLGGDPDTVCDAYEAATADMAIDQALLRMEPGHA
jgi:hypothetical protein